MIVTIKIETDNDAFQPKPWTELRRIFGMMAAMIATARFRAPLKILDANGITCGSVSVEG